MSRNPYLYLFLMAAVTYAVRVLPLTLLKRRITCPILHSFLYYVPYVTLAVMTFPAMVQATQSPISGSGFRLRSGVPVRTGAGAIKERSSAQNPRCSNAYTRRTGR